MGRGDCLKYLKREWNRKEGRGNKDFKKWGQAGSRGECLKKRGWNSLSYELWEIIIVPTSIADYLLILLQLNRNQNFHH